MEAHLDAQALDDKGKAEMEVSMKALLKEGQTVIMHYKARFRDQNSTLCD